MSGHQSVDNELPLITAMSRYVIMTSDDFLHTNKKLITFSINESESSIADTARQLG